VNGVQYGGAIVPTATAQIANIAVNVAGTVAVEFRPSNARVTFDNLSWTCYEAPTGIQNITYVAEVAKSATLRKNDEISIYPNPSTGLVHLQMNRHATYTVLNALGQEVLAGEMSGETATLDLGNYANGIYLLKVTSGNETTVKKLIINK
jgi:hypothetical protein